MPHVCNFVHGGGHDGSWLTKAVCRFRAFFESIGFEPDEITNSIKSTEFHGTFHNGCVDQKTTALSDPVYPCSTTALILIALHTEVSGKITLADFGQGRSEALVSKLMIKFVPLIKTFLRITPATDQIVPSTSILLRGNVYNFECPPFDPLSCGSMIPVEGICVYNLLLSCKKYMRSPSKHWENDVGKARLVFTILAGHIEAYVELVWMIQCGM